MRIAIDYTPAVHQGAGIGRHTRGLVQALADLEPDHQITLVVYGRPATVSIEAPASCQVRVVPVSNRWLAVAWHRLRLPLQADWLGGPVDLYHAVDFVLPPVRRARTLVTVHDLSFMTRPECADASLRSFLNRVVPRSVARADHVLADSENTRKDLIRLLKVPENKITVVYPGVETRFKPTHPPEELARVRRHYGIGDGPFILGVGTLEPRKNWPALIRAWTQLRQKGLPHRLVIAGGTGWLHEDIFLAAKASGLEEDIVMPGFVDDADLPILYAAADVFAFPSHYEGFGIPVLEAMACGTPVVCSDNSSLPEAAGKAALLVSSEDEDALAANLGALVTDPELQARLTQDGLEHARHFTWEAAARTLLATYERVGAYG